MNWFFVALASMTAFFELDKALNQVSILPAVFHLIAFAILVVIAKDLFRSRNQ